jgi:hypothetical protein
LGEIRSSSLVLSEKWVAAKIIAAAASARPPSATQPGRIAARSTRRPIIEAR